MLEATPLRSGVVARCEQRLGVQIDRGHVCGAELQRRDTRGCRSRSRNRSRVRPAMGNESNICRHSAVVGCVPVPNASPGIEPHHDRVRIVGRLGGRAGKPKGGARSASISSR